jgi:hypothetical protein
VRTRCNEQFGSQPKSIQRRRLVFVRQQALAEHFSKFPADVPRLADVAQRRVRGSDHPGVAMTGRRSRSPSTRGDCQPGAEDVDGRVQVGVYSRA